MIVIHFIPYEHLLNAGGRSGLWSLLLQQLLFKCH